MVWLSAPRPGVARRKAPRRVAEEPDESHPASAPRPAIPPTETEEATRHSASAPSRTPIENGKPPPSRPASARKAPRRRRVLQGSLVQPIVPQARGQAAGHPVPRVVTNPPPQAEPHRPPPQLAHAQVQARGLLREIPRRGIRIEEAHPPQRHAPARPPPGPGPVRPGDRRKRRRRRRGCGRVDRRRSTRPHHPLPRNNRRLLRHHAARGRVLGHERDLELRHHGPGGHHVEPRTLGEPRGPSPVEVDRVRGPVAHAQLGLGEGQTGDQKKGRQDPDDPHSTPRGWQE